MIRIEDFPNGLVDEYNAKAILRKYSIRTPNGILIRDCNIPDNLPLRYPLVVKAVSTNLLHKSESGAVMLGISSDSHLKSALEEICKRFQGGSILVEEMIRGNFETIIGVKRSLSFGHVMMLGSGGIFAEIFGDVSFRTVDLSESDISEMLNEVSVGKFLGGYRGIKISKEKIVEALNSVANLIKTEGELIESLDINPLILSENDAIAVDAKIVVSK